MPSTSFIPGLIDSWYDWGVAVAFAATFVTTLWIFFDSQSNGYKASLWRWISLLAAILVIPSVILSFSPYLAIGLPISLLENLALIGFSAVIVSLAGLIFYALGIGVSYSAEEIVSDREVLLPWAREETGNAASSTPHNTHTHQAYGVTPPRGIATTPPAGIPTGNDTIRIKKMVENELPLAWLVVLNGPYQGQEYRLQKTTDIGREREHNAIWLDDRTISRQHARIRYEKGALVIYDLASANGVFVNGRQVQRQVLAHGDRIKLGQVMLGVLLVQDDVAILPEEPTL